MSTCLLEPLPMKEYGALDTCGIYYIKNIETNKIYVGSSRDIKIRLRNHISSLRNESHHNIHLQRSFKKYGEDLFRCGILDVCELNDLSLREQFFIDYFNSSDRDFGYNIDPDAKHRVLSEETKRKISETQKGRVSNRKGVILSEETKEKLRMVNTGKVIPQDVREKIRKSSIGKNTWAAGSIRGPHTEDFKKMISLKNSGSGNGMAKVVVFIVDGMITNRWGSTVDAACFFGLKGHNVQRYIREKKVYKGGIFEYEK